MSDSIGFDLIVLSLSIAGDDPLRLASRLRAERATMEIPLLLVAEPEQHDRLLRGFDLGADDWVLRPVDENELRVRARNQIRRKFYQDRLRADLGHALELALTDPLTGLYNHRYLMRHLSGLLASGQPAGIVVMMIDIDHFKMVNDRWGHATGDQVLKQVGENAAQSYTGVRQPGAVWRRGVRGRSCLAHPQATRCGRPSGCAWPFKA